MKARRRSIAAPPFKRQMEALLLPVVEPDLSASLKTPMNPWTMQ
jgi:hypothetical protein